MDLENQTAIRRLADEVGPDKLVVVLGSTELQGIELAASTLTDGDPSYAGALAGVSLRLPVYHLPGSAGRGAPYVLAHAPALVRYGSKPRRELAARGDALWQDIRRHLREFKAAVAYP